MSLKIGTNNYLGLNIPFLDYGQGSGYIPIEKKRIGVGGFVGSGAVASGWNALSTTGKVAVGAGVGIAGTSAYDWLFGGKKALPPVTGGAGGGDYSTKYTNTNTTTTTANNQFDYSNNIISNSPNSNIKKAMSSTANATVTPDVSVSGGGGSGGAASASQGTDWATLAAIAGVALVAYGYTSRKGK